MKNAKKPNPQLLLLIGAFVLALCLRLIRLGILPLSDMEAEIALQALAVARNGGTQFGPFAAYVGLTGSDFYIFTASNFLARFWPALISALIVFVPHLFRERIGQWPATILAVVLAISPEMVGLSRIIGSPMMAYVLLLLALGLFIKRKPILAGLSLALALMSGPGFWIGALILGMSILLSEWFFNVSATGMSSEIDHPGSFWLRLGIGFGATLLVVGTVFFLEPANLSGIFSGLVAFLRGFAEPNPAPLVHIPLALIAYTAEAFFLGFWGGIRAILVRNKLDLFLLVWWVFGLIFILLYPGRQTADLIWVTLPLWLLTVRVMFFAWHLPETSRLVMVITTSLVVIVFAFLLLAFRSLIGSSLGEGRQLNFLLALIGGAVLLVAIVLLVSYGWSQEIALPGLLLGLAIVFIIGLFALSVQSTGLAPERSYELWYPESKYVSTEWLRLSMDRIIDWNASGGTPIEIAVSDNDTPSMRWFLRDDDPVDFVPYLPPQSQPGIVITGDQEIPEISNSYRGQDLVWSREVLWSEMTPFQYLSWLLTRDAPAKANQIIFWVRTDLMPDDQFSQ
jgi:hypothetical protein